MEDLRERLEASEARVRQLEEELDLLAFDNERLRAEIKELQRSRPKSVDLGQGAAKSISDVPKKLLLVNEGDKKFPNILRRRFDNVCGGSNVLVVRYASFAGRDTILCGGADRSVRCIDADSGSPIFSFVMTGPVLSVASWTYPMASSSVAMMDGASAEAILVVAAAMDGSVIIARWPTDVLQQGGGAGSLRPVALQQHGKYVVDARISPDGALVATASHDKSVNIYSVSGHDEDSAVDEDGEAWMRSKSASSGCVLVNGVAIDLKRRLRFDTVPESVAFVRPAGQPSLFLLVALRDSCSLVLVNTSSLEASLLSMNENEWDTHVSFNALHLAVAPDAATVAVSTDRDMHLVLRLEWRAGPGAEVGPGNEGSAEGAGRVVASRLHTLSGLTCGEYGKPRTSWDPTGKYLLSNSQNDYGIHIFDIGLERVVEALFGGGASKRQQGHGSGEASVSAGHRAAVRDVCCHPWRRSALSCGGDGAVIEWHRDADCTE